jgi:tRNA dimethylallyltransferase
MANRYSGTGIAIGGPTASGKSLLALRLAERLDGVVINADSLQVYAALQILTAQPDAVIQARCPHRLYGYLPAGEALTAASWAEAARQEIEAATLQGKMPIVVGGSGLYLEALLEGLAALPPISPVFRQQAEQELESLGQAEFYGRLREADPLAARLHPGDTQRILRAREVWLATGKSLYAWHEAAQRTAEQATDWRRIAVLPERTALYQACNERFLAMLAAGAIDEVRTFAAQGIASPVTRALGYAQIVDYLEGKLDRAAMIEQAQAATRHYAKRQNTWFKNRFSQPSTILTGTPSAAIAAEKIVNDLRKINDLS